MKKPISDKDVFQVLNSLKNSESNYPRELIESRRGAFTQQAAAMAGLMKSGIDGANATSASQSASTVSTASTASSGSTATGFGAASMGKILETALVVALIAEAGVAAYAYREKIADLFSSIFGPKVEQVENPSDTSPNFNTNNGTITDIPTATPTVTITETPVPPGNTLPAQTGDDNNGDSQVTSTPTPTDDGNGLHLGQTKQPTQEPKKNENNKNK